eukprot:g24882.t1
MQFLWVVVGHLHRLRKSSVILAILTLLLYNLFSVIFFTNVEGWDWSHAIYFAMVTMSTVGFGDLYPTQWYSQLVALPFILVGIVLVFGQIGSVVGLVIEPLFKGSRMASRISKSLADL